MEYIRHLFITALLFLLSCLSLEASNTDMPMGIPFFTNFKAAEYGGHNRNFDILCDSLGYTYVANFDGLLVYDNAQWRVIHTPGITRLTHLWHGNDGHIWFSGPGVEGYVASTFGDSIRVEYTQSDTQTLTTSDVQTFVDEDTVRHWNGYEVNQQLTINPNLTILATTGHGIVAIDGSSKVIHRLNKDNGLCSNNVNRLAYDGNDNIWGATDNGLFRICLSAIYTRFGENEGLEGQVNSIIYNDGKLLVGTLQGLFELRGEKFNKVQGIDLACWQLVGLDDKTTLIAAAQGIFAITGEKVKLLNEKHTLSLLLVGQRQVLTGELDGIYLRHADGAAEQKLSPMPNVTRFVRKEDGIWALSPERAAFCPNGKYEFTEHPLSECPVSMLFEYVDDINHRWHAKDNGYGLLCDTSESLIPASDNHNFEAWIRPLDSYSIQAMFVQKAIAWVGGNFGLIRLDFERACNDSLPRPHLYIRSQRLTDRDLEITFANDLVAPTGRVMYSYRMQKSDNWQPWDDDQVLNFRNLNYGTYDITVRSIDAYGQIAEADPIHIDIPYPFYLRWYTLLIYIMVLVSLGYAYVKFREKQMRLEQLRLERMVEARTVELRKTNLELKETQDELVRKEREAMVGKLTSGLIDRILNPMNYINNFSHLSLGLANDLKANIEDEEENMSEDNFDDSLDVISMIHGNLEKIEQHGLSTTRILKAMEEMLRERVGTATDMDLCALIQQNYDMMLQYHAKEIADLNIETLWQRPEQPVMAHVIGEQLSRTVMSMIGNSVYAVRKKADKHLTGYRPQIKLVLQHTDDGHHTQIQVYDNGIGIEESIQQKVFDPFFTTKPTGEAPGVGLYLSQQIVQDMGGTITLRSVKDQFTEFTITL